MKKYKVYYNLSIELSTIFELDENDDIVKEFDEYLEFNSLSELVKNDYIDFDNQILEIEEI